MANFQDNINSMEMEYGRKEIACILFTTLSLLFFVGCTRQTPPRERLVEFLDALKAKDYQTAYDHCAFRDRYTTSADEFITGFKQYDKEVGLNGIEGSAISYSIDSTQAKKDTFLAFTKITTLDVGDSPHRSLFFSVFAEPITDSVKNKKGAYVYAVTYDGVICVIKEHEGWGAYARWEEQCLRDAEESRARVEYIKNGLKVLNRKISVYPDANKAYLNAVLKNTGTRTVLDVELMIVCLDKDGKPCDILTEHPVRKHAAPLPPGKTRKFRLDLSSAPGEWAKAVDVKIVNCFLGD
jgi:hypothetical protein